MIPSEPSVGLYRYSVHTLWYEYQTNTIEYTNSWHIFIVFIPMCWAGSFSCTPPWHIFISYFNSHCQLSKMFKLANKCDFTTETISIAMPSRFVLLAWAVLHMLDRFCPTAHNDLAHSFETGWFSQRSTEYWLQKPKQWSILCRKQCLCSLMEKSPALLIMAHIVFKPQWKIKTNDLLTFHLAQAKGRTRTYSKCHSSR